MRIESPTEPTGFEPKTLRVAIENWLYNPNLEDRLAAYREVRKRLSKTFPEPDWARTIRE